MAWLGRVLELWGILAGRWWPGRARNKPMTAVDAAAIAEEDAAVDAFVRLMEGAGKDRAGQFDRACPYQPGLDRLH
jgi:hypothetical protein